MNFMQDMTKGSPLRLLLSFSVPLLIGSIFQQFYTMADSIIVGKFVGADALASIGACSSVIYLLFSLFLGLSAGIGIVISQHFGAGDGRSVRRGIANSVYILLAASCLLTLTGVAFARPILTILGTPSEIMQDAAAYFQITSAGIIAVAFYNGISSILRALGDSRTPLIFLALAALLNVGLDLLFVTVFHMGVAGAALATAIAQFASACACLAFSLKTNPYFHIRKEEFRPDTGLMRRMMHIGLPSGPAERHDRLLLRHAADSHQLLRRHDRGCLHCHEPHREPGQPDLHRGQHRPVQLHRPEPGRREHGPGAGRDKVLPAHHRMFFPSP